MTPRPAGSMRSLSIAALNRSALKATYVGSAMTFSSATSKPVAAAISLMRELVLARYRTANVSAPSRP